MLPEAVGIWDYLLLVDAACGGWDLGLASLKNTKKWKN
jgi:hypothetical protein